MKKLSKIMLCVAIVGLMSFALTGVAQAETIGWVGGATWIDSTGYFNEQPFIDLLEGAGYDVVMMLDTLRGVPMTTEQLDLAESVDLLIVGRTTNSGDYNDPLGWNSITKPLILCSVYLSRNSRWFWFNTANLINNGRSGAPGYIAVDPQHPIFAGVTPEADGLYYPLDPTIGCGNTSLHNWNDAGDDGTIIATFAAPDSVAPVDDPIAIAYWPADAGFYPETDQFAGAPRLLFPCGTQEDANICPQQGLYNLTPTGDQMFLNAVAFMLGKEVAVAENPYDIPADFNLAQNYPNPFNPSTTIEFSLPSATNLRLNVYNMLGQKVVTLADKFYQAGQYSVSWDGRDASGHMVETGVYLYRIESANMTMSKKMLLMK